MWILMKFFMLGSVCGGIAVSFVSSVLLRETDSAFWQLCIGTPGAASPPARLPRPRNTR